MASDLTAVGRFEITRADGGLTVQIRAATPTGPEEVAIAAGTAIVLGSDALSGYDAATGARLWSTEDP